jgi:pimeloyl-ACP methyl ester carboxylesterase
MFLLASGDFLIDSARMQRPANLSDIGMISVISYISNIGTESSGSFETTITLLDSAYVIKASIQGSEAIAAGEQVTIRQFIRPSDYWFFNEKEIYIDIKTVQKVELNQANNTAKFNNALGLLDVPYNQNSTLMNPVIFIHGLGGNNETWSYIREKLQNTLGLNYGGEFRYCLNFDQDMKSSVMSEDVRFLTDEPDISEGDFYSINFDVDPNGKTKNEAGYFDTKSNKEAVYKQGLALNDMIDKVLAKSLADKVILVAHSMGGLAPRHVIQNIEGNSRNSKIAKFVTFGTPHSGSALADFEGSNAGRDLDSDLTNVFLWGGYEKPDGSFFSASSDVNSNGIIGDSIKGLASSYTLSFSNNQYNRYRCFQWGWCG